MRVMEVALKVLGRDLGISYAPSWEFYIRQITKLIEQPHGDKPPSWRRKEAFYKEVMADLVAIKYAWRNPTMHIVDEFDVDRAAKVYGAIESLIKHLAEKGLKEKGKPVAVTVALAATA